MIEPNKQVTPVDLCVLLDRKADEIASSLNCVSIGTIQSFDSTDQTATVSINYLKYTEGESPKSYALLLKCPVFFLSGSSCHLTFPITAGDTCIVLFCDREIDTWLNTGGTAVPSSMRMHDMNDAIALVGIRSLANKLTDYYTLGPELRIGTSHIRIDNIGNIDITGTKVSIKNASYDLKTGLDTLLNALKYWVDTHGDTPNPATLSAIEAARAYIDGVLQ